MTDLIQNLNTLKRPRLLVRAARAGISDYVRDRDLDRLVPSARTPSPKEAVSRLLAVEDALESTRREGSAAYCVMRHVDVLIALMAEARALPRIV